MKRKSTIERDKKAAEALVEILKGYGPGRHEMSGQEFINKIAPIRDIYSRFHQYLAGTLQIAKEILGGEENLIIPKIFSKHTVVVFTINEEVPEKENNNETSDENRLIQLTYKFNTLSRQNQRGNLLIMSERDMKDMGTSIEELLSLVNTLGAKGSTIVPDGTGKYNFQGFDTFIKALRAEELKIQTKKRKVVIDDLLSKGLGEGPLAKELLMLFKSYNPENYKIDPDLVTNRIFVFWNKHKELSEEVVLPTPEFPFFRKKGEGKFPASIEKTWKRITEVYSESDEEEEVPSEENTMNKRISDFLVMNFLHYSEGVPPTDVNVIEVNPVEIHYTVTIVSVNMEKLRLIKNKLTNVNSIKVDFENNLSVFDISYKFSNRLEYSWIALN